MKESQVSFEIRPLAAEDWEEVRRIYLEGIATGQATFEIDAPGWEQWNAGHSSAPRLVATSSEQVLGWAALGQVSARRVYSGVAEVSVYVDWAARGKGIGRALLERLVAESEISGIWMLQASVFPENQASVALHKACGFREVGLRERIGKLNGKWRNTLLMERRSKVIGAEK